MAIHDFDKDMLPDNEFKNGEYKFLVKGNKCRNLDDRRTPGFIEEFFEDIGIFRFRITKFEDKGSYWDLPVEQVNSFQFHNNSKELTDLEIIKINNFIENNKEIIIIESNKDTFLNTQNLLLKTKTDLIKWLENRSLFFKRYKEINLKKHYSLLSKDLINYLKEKNLYELEEITAKTLVKNPNSGEWIKGLEICLAEMGLTRYEGKKPRTKDIFNEIGDKKLRREYLIHRLAFIRAYFELLKIKEIEIYRGMSSQVELKNIPKTFISYTTDLKVAKSFFNTSNKFKNSYLIKRTIPIEKIFMSFIETKEMDSQYKEKEILIFYDENKF